MIQILEPVECDVLVVGGGSAGMMAAIEAAGAGAKVILAEKADTRRSGSSATGNDHFQCYIPEVHGSEDDWLELFMHDRPGGQGRDMDRIIPFMQESFETVKLWDSWGINMKPHGYWEFTSHNTPYIQGTHLKYEGNQQKPIMTKEALKCGVQIMNRHMLTEILLDGDGAVCGGLCLNLSDKEPRIQVIRCKSMVLCTTKVCARLNGGDRMGWMFNQHYPPNCVGEGIAAAYRAGVVISGGHLSGGDDYYGTVGNSRFFSRGGTRTWVGVHTDIHGKPCTKYQYRSDWRYGAYDQYMDSAISESYSHGRPVFMNTTLGTDEDIDYMKWALVHEGNGVTLNHLADEGFDFKKHMIEFHQGREGGGDPGGPDVNGAGETSLKGLYAAGEIVGNHLPGLSPAVIGGQIAGRNAAAYSRDRELFPAEKNPLVEEKAAFYDQILHNPDDASAPSWREANVAIMQTMLAYCGTGVVSDDLLQVGLNHMRRIQSWVSRLQAADSHELMRCLEVESLAVCGELVIVQGMSRKESRKARFGTVRYDGYPDPDPAWNGMLPTVQIMNGKPVCGRRAIVK
ncbi:MAG: FAD-binding protein [Oscillospiraceae bacterium]|nr:FAD-binding protein [Oscillospiraceae bacterium]